MIGAREDDDQIGIRPETLAAFPGGPAHRVFVTRRSEETGDGAVAGRGGNGRGREWRLRSGGTIRPGISCGGVSAGAHIAAGLK
jgi:hypothetical protein